MIALLQRVREASVTIEGTVEGQIEQGLLILLGIEHRDELSDVDWLVKKITAMRIFSDEEGKMNLSCEDVSGNYLVISQFTLHASVKKGNRPSYIDAARPDQAIPLYNSFLDALKVKTRKDIQSGKFGADMKVSLINDGPVTIIIDSRDRK
ncbi:MAG: D-aminoacyl-tRNA deacylase [Cyclobacteriaceae bacterium]